MAGLPAGPELIIDAKIVPASRALRYLHKSPAPTPALSVHHRKIENRKHAGARMRAWVFNRSRNVATPTAGGSADAHANPWPTRPHTLWSLSRI